MAVVIAVTFKCVPLFRVSEVSYLSSVRDIVEQRIHRPSKGVARILTCRGGGVCVCASASLTFPLVDAFSIVDNPKLVH